MSTQQSERDPLTAYDRRALELCRRYAESPFPFPNSNLMILAAKLAYQIEELTPNKIGVFDPDERAAFPVIVTLCGSTRFSSEYQAANLWETLRGRIVLTIGADMKSDDSLFADIPDAERAALKVILDRLHLRKIDLADQVLFLNPDGYMGDSTRRELEYAISKKKTIRFLEPPTLSDMGVCRAPHHTHDFVGTNQAIIGQYEEHAHYCRVCGVTFFAPASYMPTKP